MNFVADENIDNEIIEGLREAGYNVMSITENFPGIPDENVLDKANENRAILITADKDFGELVFRRGRLIEGVILIRIFGIPQEDKVKVIFEAFKNYSTDFPENFTVIGREKIRIKSMDGLR